MNGFTQSVIGNQLLLLSITFLETVWQSENTSAFHCLLSRKSVPLYGRNKVTFRFVWWKVHMWISSLFVPEKEPCVIWLRRRHIMMEKSQHWLDWTSWESKQRTFDPQGCQLHPVPGEVGKEPVTQRLRRLNVIEARLTYPDEIISLGKISICS